MSTRQFIIDFSPTSIERFFSGKTNSLLSHFSQLAVDITEKEQEYEIKAHVPGFKKEDITINLGEDNVLSILADVKKENTQEAENGTVIAREIFNETLSRKINLPKNISASDIKASQVDGVLTIVIPKKQPQLPSTQQIQIS